MGERNGVNSTALCRVADLTDGGLLRVANIDPLVEPVAVAKVGEEIFVIDDTCTHQAASLADGWLEYYCVECPLHESRFDVRTGEPDAPPAREPVATHAIEIVDGVVYLKDAAK